MSSARLSILVTLVISALTAVNLGFPALSVAQAEVYLENWNFEVPGAGSSLPGWQGGRRAADPRGVSRYAAEIRGPAGIIYQTINTAEAKKILDLAKGRVTISFTLISTGDTGLVVSFGGRVFDADQHRSPLNPDRVEITFDNYRFTNPGDRTLSFQVKSPGRRVYMDDVHVMYTPLGPDGGGVVEPTPTPSQVVMNPPGTLGQYPAVFPYATPTPAPAASLGVDSLRVSVNPPIIYVAPGQGGALPGENAARAAIRLDLIKTDGTRMTEAEFEQRKGEVRFEYLDSLFEEDENGNVRQLRGRREELGQVYFVPEKVEDAEQRLLVRVELDMPRTGQIQEPMTGQTPNLPQRLELATIVPISVRVLPGTPAKGTREVRGLAPIERFNRLFLER